MYSASCLCSELHAAQPAQKNDVDDDATIVMINLSRDNTELAMLNSGTTYHFLTFQSKCNNVQTAQNLIAVTIPNGDTIKSTATCDIDWPFLPRDAQRGHIIPQLKNQALISVVKLCNNGCDVIFWYNCCLVLYKGNIVLYGI